MNRRVLGERVIRLCVLPWSVIGHPILSVVLRIAAGAGRGPFRQDVGGGNASPHGHHRAVTRSLALAFGAGLRVLDLLGVPSLRYWDELTTGLIISGGTQGINSIVKFLGYAKEGKKADAAAKLTSVKNHVKSFADRV